MLLQDSVSETQTWTGTMFLHLWAMLSYVLLTSLFFAPLIPQFFDHLPEGGDHWIFYWDLWWIKKALVELHTTPFHTSYVNFPQGATLYFHTLSPLNGILALPLQLLGMDLIASYNTLVVVGYVTSGYTMFLLADYVVKHKPAAFIAGVVFTFSPVHVARVFGQLNLVTLQWLPLYVLTILMLANGRISARKQVGVIVLAAVLLVCNALTEWTLALFLVMFTGLHAAYLLWTHRKGWSAVLRGPILRFSAVMVIFAVLIAPILLPMLQEAGSNRSVRLDPFESIIYSADLIGFLTPPAYHPLVGHWSSQITRHFSGNTTEHTTYLGMTVLLLMAYAIKHTTLQRTDPTSVTLREPARELRFWLFLAIVFLVLALGPRLHIIGRTVFSVFRLTVPLPYAVIYYLPFFAIMRTPARFAVMAMLAVAIVVAIGVRGLSEHSAWQWSSSRRRWLTQSGLFLCITLMITSEFVPRITTQPPTVPAIYTPLIFDPNSNHAVLELPYRPVSHYYIAQTRHNKPLVGGYLARPIANPVIESNVAIQTLALQSLQPGGTEADLGRASVRYVVVNWWLLTAQEQEQMQQALQIVFGRAPNRVMSDTRSSRPYISLFVVKER